ncbi:zinc finger MYM-type 1-like [Pelobates cultripes]|uniref:Zinc finger MYM-type 1-like n=1 Tax=Pelobates cultripes TaxID=61616 RepID=A0AAD1RNN1_PELCU|nr:zinc finger MYM-type 1-like [Pelobates cultripes]
MQTPEVFSAPGPSDRGDTKAQHGPSVAEPISLHRDMVAPLEQLDSEEFHSLLDATMSKSVTQAIFTAMGVMSNNLSHSISSAIKASNPNMSQARAAEGEPLRREGQNTNIKRNRPSGSQQRKFKKAREKSADSMSGSILKYVAPSTSTAVGERAEDIQSVESTGEMPKVSSQEASYVKALFAVDDKVTGASSFVTEFQLWWKLYPKVSSHEASDQHLTCLEKWKTLKLQKCLVHVHQTTVDREKRKWRDILHCLLDVTLFLAHQNLPFRGHRETMSSANNFLELDKIVADIKKAKYFGILYDSTPDVSHTDQMCEVIRYVHIEGDHVNVKESFLGFFPVAEKTAAAELTENILQHLEEDGLDISLCRGQGYDNAATMAGIHGGVQAKIKEIIPNALFMPCANHSLNLCGVHSFGSVASCVTFFGTLERGYSFFSVSTHRVELLMENLVLEKVNITQKYLQTVGLTLEKCIVKLQGLKAFLADQRSEIVEKAICYATTTCKEMDISMERRGRVELRKTMPGEKAKDAGLTLPEEMKRAMFECLDRFPHELEIRSQPNSLVVATEKDIRNYTPKFTEIFDEFSNEDIFREIERLWRHLEAAKISAEEAKKWTALQFLEFIVKWDYCESVTVFIFFLTLCVSIAPCERSFSKSKLLKKFFCSTMSETRLTNLAILSIEHEYARKIGFDEVINKFAEM